MCVRVCVSNTGSILAVLNDPSFEHRQPSWVRRSLRITHRVAPPTIVPATDAAGVRGRRRRREGDQVDWGFRGTREVDMETEFVSEREGEQHGAGAPAVRITHPPTCSPCVCQREPCLFCDNVQLLQPGVDNTLSSYLNQRSVEGGEWQRRWYVLTNRALICYETHSVSPSQADPCVALLLSVTSAMSDSESILSMM